MKYGKSIIIALAILTMATCALAQPGYGFKRAGAGGFDGPGYPGALDGDAPMMYRLMAYLDLSEEQQVAIAGIQEACRDEGLSNRMEILRLQNELHGLMLADAPDAGDVEKLARRIGDLRTEQRLRRMNSRLAVRALLTDDQRVRMISRMGSGGPGHGGQGQGFRGPRGGFRNDFRPGVCDGDGPYGRRPGRGRF